MKNINHLLEKYWKSETTLHEENILREYFTSDSVPPDHKQYADLFNYFSLSANVAMPDGKKAKTITMVSRRERKSWLRPMMGAAASLVIMFAVFTFYNNTNPSMSDNVYVVESPDEALEITKDALAFLSINVDKGTSTMNTNIKKMSSTNIIK